MRDYFYIKIWIIINFVSCSTDQIIQRKIQMAKIQYNLKENCTYSLPYSINKKYPVIQGYFGNFSHSSPFQYSIDFKMPVGTPIHAARSGKVIESISHFFAGGRNIIHIRKANYIKILHKDGTIGFYAHLKNQGSLVKKNEMILRGQLLGLSGCSGFCTVPHLHFEVFLPKGENKRQSLPITFQTKVGKIPYLKKGQSYFPFIPIKKDRC